MMGKDAPNPTIFDAIAADIAAGRGHRDNEPAFSPVPPETPISSVPGSSERIADYRRRLEAGEDLWGESDTPPTAAGPLRIGGKPGRGEKQRKSFTNKVAYCALKTKIRGNERWFYPEDL